MLRHAVSSLRRFSPSSIRTIYSAPAAISSDTARNFFPLNSLSSKRVPVLLLKGASDTIGLEVTGALVNVFSAANVPVDFRVPDKDLEIDDGLTQEVIDLFSETRVALKGPYFTPIGAKETSINVSLRTRFDLFANVVHAYNVPGIETRHKDVDIVLIRENTEGEYSGLEHSAAPGVVESLKIITEEKSRRIAEYAFQYAVANNRKKVTAVHKANIMKSADGLFLECCSDVAKRYPFIEFEAMIVDNTCMQMASRPQQFDVMVLPNLYGNIVSNIATGLVGGPGVFPGANIGHSGGIFEQGSRHSARSLAGQQVANPTATILGGVLMLRYLKMDDHADVIEKAVKAVYENTDVRTKDLAGDAAAASTTEFTQAIIDHLEPVS